MVIGRSLTSIKTNSGILLEAVRVNAQNIRLFFNPQVTPKDIVLPSNVTLQHMVVLNGYPCLSCEVPANLATLSLTVQGQPLEVNPAEAEYALFAGRNVFIAERNGETPQIVFDWLRYHIDSQGLSGAVILNRDPPQAAAAFLAALRDLVDAAKLDCPVVVLSSAVPLGKPKLPPESHPAAVAEAPGKDRMDIPPPDPWRSALGFPLFYEVVRYRFLQQARAVANLDVHDILRPDGGSIFDQVQETQNGMLPLVGRHCFPWRVRNGAEPHFGDHLCVQFDQRHLRQRWCAVPGKLAENAFWMIQRVRNLPAEGVLYRQFYRCMGVRHSTDAVSLIVPKASLVEDNALREVMKQGFDANPVGIPQVETEAPTEKNGRRAILTCMKNEGPFILEWLAYHRAIGFQDFLVYTNDCEDGTDQMFDLLQAKGLLQHRENPYREAQYRAQDMKPQHAAFAASENEPVIADAEWVACIDVDEYVNIKTGDGTLDALFAAVPDANMIAMTWRLFGNNEVTEYRDEFITEQFLRCAREFANKPHQAWGFKTLFQNIGIFKKMGVHRPKGLNPQLWEKINWVNGSGKPLPEKMYRNAWRSDAKTYGYDLVQLNHYAVRSTESFLVKRDRGRVNHVDRDQGLAYWFRMNNNAVEDHSILPRLEAARAEYDRLMQDPEIRAMHETCVANHRAKIKALLETENYKTFYGELMTPRMNKLSRLHSHFGANVFLQGPNVVPDDIVNKDPDEEFFFTVEEGKTVH